MDDAPNLVEVKIGALIMDPNTNTPIVVLKGVESEIVLPIWVGAFEANAIALEIEKIVPQRPMTHDLLRNVILQCELTATSVVITDLLENEFYALKRFLLLESLANQAKNRHFAVRPFDTLFAFRGKVDVLDVVLH